MVNDIINKLKDCDDFHNRCDCLLEHDEITYLLEYIEELKADNNKNKKIIYNAIDYIDQAYILKAVSLMKILKGDE